MGLIILGAENLASDQADQNPNTYKRSKEPATNPWPEPTGWIEYKYDHDKNPVKMIYHNYITMPTVTIPDTVTEIDLKQTKLTEIPNSWLSSNTSVLKVNLPDGLKKIGNFAFYESALVSCYMPDSLEAIGVAAFERCYSLQLFDSFFPAGLKKIGAYAFANCISINISRIPDTVNDVGTYDSGLTGSSFYNCSSIQEMHTGPSTNLKIDTFANCGQLALAEFAGETLQSYVYHNSGLKKIWIRETCQIIQGSSYEGSFHSPFLGCPDDLVIYAEADAKPDRWSEYFNRVGDGTVEATVVYSQKTSPF